MTAPAPVKRAADLALRLAAAVAFLPPLLTRFFLGHAFYFTGRGKLQNPEGVVQFFTTLGIPAPALNAAFVSRLEYYGAMLLVAGLATRPVAAMLAVSMLVALLTADRDDFIEKFLARGDSQQDITTVAPLVLLLGLLWLTIYGPGLLSLDAIVKKALGLGERQTK
jgi:putative oxidoreductase